MIISQLFSPRSYSHFDQLLFKISESSEIGWLKIREDTILNRRKFIFTCRFFSSGLSPELFCKFLKLMLVSFS